MVKMMKMQKKLNQKHTKTKTSLLVMSICMAILMLNFASAFDFDNVIKYSEDFKSVEIVNAFDIPLLNTKIATIKLANPLTNNYIEVGKDRVVFQMEIESFNDNYIDAIKSTKILNLNAKGREVSKDFKWVYAIYGDVKVDDWGTSCKQVWSSINQTNQEVCERKIIGSHTENQIIEWREFTGKDIVKGTITLGLMTDVEVGDYYDGIPNLFGKEITSWVSWLGIVKDTSANNWGQSDPASQPYFGSMFQIKSDGNTQIVSWTLNSNSSNAIQCGLTVSKNEVYMGSLSGTNCSFASPPTLANGTMFYAWSSRNNETTGWTYGADYSATNPDAQTNVKWLSATYSGTGWNCVNNTAQLYEVQYVYSRKENPDSSPSITLQTPTDNSVFRTSNVSFFLNASDDLGMTNLSLIIGGVINYTNTSVDLISSIDLQLNFSDGTYVWNGNAVDTADQQTNGTARTITINTKPNIDFVTPTPTNNTNTTSLSFQVNVTTTDTYFKNITFYLFKNGVFDTSQEFEDTTRLATFGSLTDGVYTYNVSVWTTTGQYNNTETRTISVDTTSPTVLIGVPVNATTYTNLSATYYIYSNATITDAGLSSCWYSVDGGATTITSCVNPSFSSLVTTGWHTLSWYANDSVGHQTSNTTSFFVNLISSTQSGSTTASEGTSQTFTLLVSGSSSIGTAYGELWYNGVNRGTTTTTVINPNSTQFSKTFVIPDGYGNSTGNSLNWYWLFNTTSLATSNTSTQTQKVYSMELTDCNVTTGRIILNLSLRDEEDLSLLNITLPEITNLEIDLEVSSLADSSVSWDISKQWANNNSVQICVPNELLNSSSYNIDFTIGFSGTDHVQEFYYLEDGNLSISDNFNSYTDNTIDLMDLLTADSTTFLFEFTGEDNLKVDDALVHTFRKYIGEGLFREVERSKQDNNGQTHVHLVEEDVIYYFMVTQYGIPIYTSGTYNAKCLSSPCEIGLTASTTETNWSDYNEYNQVQNYTISTNKDTRISTLLFKLNSSVLVNYTIYQSFDGTVKVINSSTLTSASGSINLYIPLSYNNATFFGVVYRDNEFINSYWISLEEDGSDYFGTFGAILGALILLTIVLMAVSEGIGLIIFMFLGLIIIGVMQLVNLSWMAIVSIICAGGIIIMKLVSRRGKAN